MGLLKSTGEQARSRLLSQDIPPCSSSSCKIGRPDPELRAAQVREPRRSDDSNAVGGGADGGN